MRRLLILIILLSPILLFAFPSESEAAIARSGTSTLISEAAVSILFEHDNGSPTNGLTLFSVGNLQGVNNMVSSSYGGKAMTELSQVPQAIDNWFFGVLSPNAGNQNGYVEFGASQTIRGAMSSYSGVSQLGLPDASSTGFDNGSAARDLTVSVTVVAENAWLVAGVLNDSGDITAGTGANLVGGGTAAQNGIFDSNGTVSTGLQSMQITWAVSNDVDMNLISIAPAVAAPAGGRTCRGRCITR